jgi:hypothetical protein
LCEKLHSYAVMGGHFGSVARSGYYPVNTYVGEWPDTDQETSTIMDAALGRVPRMCPAAAQRK